MTADNVGAYIAELKERVSSVTVHGSISKLRRTAQLVAPDRDFTWLTDIEKGPCTRHAAALEIRPRGHD